tara:strand:- start:198 stop:1046 length:849 start_codon:yes stop_codon:yes gene_type:complete
MSKRAPDDPHPSSDEDEPPPPKPKKQRNGVKHLLRSVLEELDKELEDENLNEGAHLRISNGLKAIFDANASTKTQHIQEYLLDTLSDDPFGFMTVHLDYRPILEKPSFWRKLIVKTKKRYGDKAIPQKWWEDALEWFLPEWSSPNYKHAACVCLMRVGVIVLLETRWNTLEPLIARLDDLKIEPSTLFPVEEDDDDGPGVFCMLRAEPRFLRWLLKDGHAYSKPAVNALRKSALLASDKTAERDPLFVKALGLRNCFDLANVSMSLMMGGDFNEARKMALAR